MHITFMFSISLQLSIQGYVNMYVFHLKIKIEKLMHKKMKHSLKRNLFFLIKKEKDLRTRIYNTVYKKFYSFSKLISI